MKTGFENVSLEDLKNELSEHINNQNFFRIEQDLLLKGLKISEDLSGKNLRRANFFGCTFEKSDLSRTGFAGSTFQNCVFKNTNMYAANMSQCTFKNCIFEDSIDNVNFQNSKFLNVKFSTANIYDTIYSNAYLNNVCFDNCNILSASWEFCDFFDVNFNSCTLSKLNFEFSIWRNIDFNNTFIPFQTVPYIFGGPTYVLESNKNLKIRSNVYKEGIDKLKYKEYLLKMLEFYKRTDNIFPEVNLLLALDDIDSAYERLKYGVKKCVHTHQFRMLRYIIYLFNTTKKIPLKRKSEFYQEIIDIFDFLNNDESIDDFDKKTYINLIRSTLLPTNATGGCIFSIKTDIKSTDIDSISNLYKLLDTCMEIVSSSTYKIDIRHNSPTCMEILTTAMPAILNIIGSVLTIVLACINVHDKLKINITENNSIEISNSNSSVNISTSQENTNLNKEEYYNLISELLETAEKLKAKGVNLSSVMALIPADDSTNSSSNGNSVPL